MGQAPANLLTVGTLTTLPDGSRRIFQKLTIIYKSFLESNPNHSKQTAEQRRFYYLFSLLVFISCRRRTEDVEEEYLAARV